MSKFTREFVKVVLENRNPTFGGISRSLSALCILIIFDVYICFNNKIGSAEFAKVSPVRLFLAMKNWLDARFCVKSEVDSWLGLE